MIIKRDDDRAKKVEKALEANGGYCPCRLEKIPKNKCMCREFQMDIMQHDWYGKCKCGLYEKVREDEKTLFDDAGKIV